MQSKIVHILKFLLYSPTHRTTRPACSNILAMSSHTELTTLSNVVDFHDVDLSSPGDFKEFQKKMKENVTRAVFLQLRNAALKSEYSSALFTTLKRAVHLEALDVSNNSLRAPFEHALTDYLKVSLCVSGLAEL